MGSTVEIASSFIEGAPPGEVRLTNVIVYYYVLRTKSADEHWIQLGDVVAGKIAPKTLFSCSIRLCVLC